METVKSKDGTSIAFERSGSGPPLVLVHGTTADHTRWRSVLPQLEERYTVFAMDRRGRGSSGDSEAYSLEAEYEEAGGNVQWGGKFHGVRAKNAHRSEFHWVNLWYHATELSP